MWQESWVWIYYSKCIRHFVWVYRFLHTALCIGYFIWKKKAWYWWAICLTIATNADKRKPMKQPGIEYFGGRLSASELVKGMESNVLIYRSGVGKVNATVLFNHDTFWLSQKRMAELWHYCFDYQLPLEADWWEWRNPFVRSSSKN